tara:strand:- start:185 stop:1252 length:1068 start_codon:yes stop_codon:yes gene_type:complete
MIKYLCSHIISLRYILLLIKHNQNNPPKVEIKDESYRGLDGTDVILRIFKPKKRKRLSIIIFPGASPSAEKHPGIINLASIIAKLGYQVYIPRIPPLKKLNISEINIDWFAHAYEQILNRDEIDSNNVTITGISYGGSLLLNSSLDKRMNSPKPKSLLIYGAAYEIDTGLDFLLSGKLTHNNNTIHITPNEWGITVILHNYLKNIDVGFDTKAIREILTYRIADDMKTVDRLKEKLNSHDKEFVNNVLNATYNEEIEKIVKEIIFQERDNLQKISPKIFSNKIDNKVFIMHGANDSMVPFTESVKMGKDIQNSEVLISYLYEHKEISTNSGIFSKLKELFKMERFFASYFRYNEN